MYVYPNKYGLTFKNEKSIRKYKYLCKYFCYHLNTQAHAHTHVREHNRTALYIVYFLSEHAQQGDINVFLFFSNCFAIVSYL